MGSIHKGEINQLRIKTKPLIAVLDFQEDEIEFGCGRFTAETIAIELSKSNVFGVMDRSQWQEKLGGKELTAENRFHPAWAAERLPLIGADALVIGRLSRSMGGETLITVALVDASGVVLDKIERNCVDAIVRLLAVKHLARKIRTRDYPIEARIEAVEGSSLMMSLRRDSDLKRDDRLLIDRIIETISDPLFEDEFRVLSHLVATVGEALVLDAGVRFTLARYTGACRLRIGDNVTLSRI
jgi:hypothetical protein